MAVVKKTLSPRTIGCDQAAPGTSTCQAMFFSADHSLGAADPAATPACAGPRNCVQSAAAVVDAIVNGIDEPTRQSASKRRRIRILQEWWYEEFYTNPGESRKLRFGALGSSLCIETCRQSWITDDR
jgi:hypothetical protein